MYTVYQSYYWVAVAGCFFTGSPVIDDVDEDDDVFVTDPAAPTVPSVVAQSKRRTRSLSALKEDPKSPKKVMLYIALLYY